VIAYYTSLFGVMLPSNPSPALFMLIVATVVTVSWLRWSAIAYFFTLASVRRRFVQARHWVDRVMGTLLVVFGLKLMWSR
jgi:threonine efflux protein